MTAEEVTFVPPTLDDAFTFAQHGPLPKDLTGYFKSQKALRDFGPYLRRHHIHPHTGASKARRAPTTCTASSCSSTRSSRRS